MRIDWDQLMRDYERLYGTSYSYANAGWYTGGRGYSTHGTRIDEDLETGWYVPPEDDSDLPDGIHYAGVILSDSITVSDVDIAMVDKYEMDEFSRHFDSIPNLHIDMLLDRKLWHIYSGIPVVTTMEKN